MGNRPASGDLLYLGVDGGGTKCRAVLVDADARVIGEGRGGPANPYHGVARALESVVNATDNALASAGLGPEDKSRIVAGLGLAGVNVPSLYATVQQWDHPYYARYLTTDLHIACIAAHDQSDGAVIVAGNRFLWLCPCGQSVTDPGRAWFSPGRCGQWGLDGA